MDRMSQMETLLACFIIASLGGLAQLMRTGRPLTVRLVVATGLYTGIAGLVVAMYVFGDSKNSIMTVATAGACGLGGTAVLDFLISSISRGTINLSLQDSREEEVKDDRAPRN